MDRKPLDISHCRGSRVLEKIAFPPDVAVLVAGEVPGYPGTLVQLHSYPIHWQVLTSHPSRMSTEQVAEQQYCTELMGYQIISISN